MSRSRSTSSLPARRAGTTPRALQSLTVHRSRRRELEQKLAALQKDYAELHTALFEAAEVHRRVCAPRYLRYGSFHIASEIFAVRQLPGDFVIAQETPREIMLALGDVCGKGLAAAMWVTHLAGLVAMHASVNSQPQAIAAEVNRDFQRMPAMPLTSLFQARLDPFEGTLDYCNAGHPPALLVRADGEMEALSEGGPVLGAIATGSFIQERVYLQPGDMLIVYSDGILDSANHAGEQFGYERWEQYVRRVEKVDADATLFSLLGAVQDFAGGCPLEDDMSLVVISRNTTEGA
jgi:sigma-B regulation protein RsbU (phosphoserine phosphatase)